MALIVEFTVPTSKFALFNTLTAIPDATFELGRVITATPESITVYVWARAPDFDALEAAFDDDPSVSSFTVSSETADEHSYRMTWNEPIDLLIHIMTEQEGTIIHAASNTNSWSLRVSFPKRNALAQAQELKDLAQQNEFSLDIRRIYSTDEYRRAQPAMTANQQESLVRAFEAGYFKVPKETKLTELADAQGVSHQAMSERIRRGVHHLIAQTLITRDSTDQDEK
ncbi:bacterio-opsin activator domain-containing protein [Halalkalicoccus salilacus]|uniref:bacterio-opsin activator domain-containing protein n=1 Tax=Halalkalicoccus salilacus TaxID=3117459 RepID=UPI00300E748E